MSNQEEVLLNQNVAPEQFDWDSFESGLNAEDRKEKNELEEIYKQGKDKDALIEKLGKRRAKRGMFEGDLEDGELEIGQSSALIDEILTVEQVFQKLLKEFSEADFSKF